MLIDGCFIPDQIYAQQREIAIATGKTRQVGVISVRKGSEVGVISLRKGSGLPNDPFSFANIILDPLAYLRQPEWLRYWIGPTYDELRASGECAMILHISPRAEAV